MNQDNLAAAVELHRPVFLDKYGNETTDPEAAKWIRCNECREFVTVEGCRTWQTANN